MPFICAHCGKEIHDNETVKCDICFITISFCIECAEAGKSTHDCSLDDYYESE